MLPLDLVPGRLKLYNTPSAQASIIRKSVEESILWKSYKKLFSVQFGNSPYFPIGEKTTITLGKISIVIMKMITASK